MCARKRISLNDKLKLINDYNKGARVFELSEKYKLKASTVSTIIKYKENFIKRAEKFNNLTKRKSIKNGEFPRMERKLYYWFVRQRKLHIPISGAILQHQAKKIHKKLYGGRFNASYGWLTRFKKRFGIRLLKHSGEKLSSNTEHVDPFKREFHKVIIDNNLTKEAIFNADETGLYWKTLPEKTYVHSSERCAPGRKISKERVTVLLCSNASGTKKITPLMIGKSQNPRAFRNKTIPLDYTYSKNAWMTSVLFKTWFFEKFIPQVSPFK